MGKTIIEENLGNVSDFLIHDHYLIKGARTLEKLSSKELNSLLIKKFTNKSASNVQTTTRNNC